MGNDIHSELLRGNINTIILRVLYDGDRYGYDIIKEIDEKSSGQYKLKQSTLYSCLNRLEAQGFICSYWGEISRGGRRKYYALTDMGKDVFVKNQTEWEYSRTIVDKLISERDVDLAEVSTSGTKRVKARATRESRKLEQADDDDIADDIDNETDDDDIADYADNEPVDDADNIESNDDAQKADDIANEANETEQSDLSKANTDIISRMLSDRGQHSYIEQLAKEGFSVQESDKEPLPKDFESYFVDYDDEQKDELDESAQTDDGVLVYEPPNDAENKQKDASDEQASPQAPPHGTDSKISEYRKPLASAENDGKGYITREYRSILQSIAKVAQPAKIEQPKQEVKTPEKEAPPPQDDALPKAYSKLDKKVKTLGNELRVRPHNNGAARQYANTYYYYSNKLMLFHYAILFVLMLLQISISFFVIKMNLGYSQQNDLWYYFIALIVAVCFPATAFMSSLNEPQKRKRNNFYFPAQLLYRSIAFLYVALFIYGANIVMEMPLIPAASHATSFYLPLILALNIPLSAVIYNILFKTGKFNIDE